MTKEEAPQPEHNDIVRHYVIGLLNKGRRLTRVRPLSMGTPLEQATRDRIAQIKDRPPTSPTTEQLDPDSAVDPTTTKPSAD